MKLHRLVRVKGKIGDIEITIRPKRTDNGVLEISTNENFGITVSTKIEQEVKYTFKFSNDSVKSPPVALKGHTKITHRYEKEANYTVEIIASVLGYNKTLYVRVVARKCGPPSLFFPDEYTESDPQVITKATDSFHLNTRIEEQENDCNNKGKRRYQWNMTSVEGVAKSSESVASFHINPRALKAGNYSVSLLVTYSDSQGETKYSFRTYMRVEKSNLVAKMKGGSLRQIDSRSTENLTLDASDSYDPDVAQGTQGWLTFEWQCKVANISIKSVTDELCNSTTFLDLSTNKEIASYDIARFRENVKYTFKVTITAKDTRLASVTQDVMLRKGIPSLEIR